MTQSKLERAAGLSASYLTSEAARLSLRRDPYWPKWDSPWWHMTLLWELGLAEHIPESAARELVASMDRVYLKTFPFRLSELPAGMDPYRNIACHCALGTAFQVIAACGLDPDKELPWARPWFLKYQLPDGGLNCNEDAYIGSKKSSFLSTLPPLESILFCTKRPFTQEEEAFLDRGAEYLLSHRLFRSLSGKVIDENWLKPCFPRFYDYDVLRGLSFLAHWGAHRGKTWRDRAGEALEAAGSWAEKGFPLERKLVTERSLVYTGGEWVKGKANYFPLLEEAHRPEIAAAALRDQWARIGCAGRC